MTEMLKVDGYLIQCCVCKKFKTSEGWKVVEKNIDMNKVTHGYCNACYREELKNEVKRHEYL